MSFARRQRRSLASLVLGVWLLALFAGIAHACLPGDSPAAHESAQVAHDGDSSTNLAPAGCVKACNEGVPLLAKLQVVQDQPAGQPLLVAHAMAPLAPALADVVAVVHRTHPPPDVPVLLRSLRLAL